MALHLRKVRSLLGIERRAAPDDLLEVPEPLLEQAEATGKRMNIQSFYHLSKDEREFIERYVETRERLLDAAISVIGLSIDDPRLDDLNEAINDCNRVNFDENGTQSSATLTGAS
jgi:hypothetical protein